MAMWLLCSCNASKGDGNQVNSVPVTDVTVTHVGWGHVQSSLAWQAVSTYQRKSWVVAPVASYVVQSCVNLGEMVQSGTTLFVLESKERHALQDENTPGRVVVKSPCRGVVTEIQQQSGNYVPEGGTLCSVADLASLAFEAEVPFEQRNSLKEGEKCRLLLPDSTWLDAVIERPLLAMNTQSQTQKFIARTAPRFLPEGLIVRMVADGGPAAPARQILPKSALQCDVTMSEFWVMVVKNDSIACKVPVTVGTSDSQQVEIITPLFSPRDLIVSTGGYSLLPQSHVRIVKP